jgi:hypothetical protein
VLILVHTAHPQAVAHAGDGFGRLLSPRQFSRAADTAAAGIPWAADNDCFQGLNSEAYTRMLDAIQGVPGCLFVTVPDVVGDSEETARLFELWAPAVRRRGLPVALVAQDGIGEMELWLKRTWHRLDALFVGGTTEFKLSAEAERLVREAKTRGRYAHMGRVNSRKRFDYARQIGCDSIDGSKFSRWRDTWLPDALGWHRDHLQERMTA